MRIRRCCEAMSVRPREPRVETARSSRAWRTSGGRSMRVALLASGASTRRRGRRCGEDAMRWGERGKKNAAPDRAARSWRRQREHIEVSHFFLGVRGPVFFLRPVGTAQGLGTTTAGPGNCTSSPHWPPWCLSASWHRLITLPLLRRTSGLAAGLYHGAMVGFLGFALSHLKWRLSSSSRSPSSGVRLGRSYVPERTLTGLTSPSNESEPNSTNPDVSVDASGGFDECRLGRESGTARILTFSARTRLRRQSFH